MRRYAKPPRLKQAPLGKKYKRLIQVEKRRPHLILVANKHFFCLRKQLDRFKRLSLAASGDGGKAQRLRRFITKAEILERFIRGASKFTGLGAKIEF